MITTTQSETINVNVQKDHGLGNQQPVLDNKREYKVYKVTNIDNGMSYIGYTSRRICDRWDEHVANSRGKRKRKSKLYTAIAEYGSKAFKRELLDIVNSEDDAKRLETFYIKKYDTYNNGYNSNLGGCGFFVYTDEWKKNVQDGMRKAKRLRESGLRSDCDSQITPKAEFWAKGASNPMAKSYLISCPNGTEVMVTGIKEFCRNRGIHAGELTGKRGRSKGYVVLKRFNDQKFTSYTQASGNSE